MTDGATIGIVIVAIVLILIFVVAIGGRMIEYTLEYWISQARGEAVDISYMGSCIAALFVGWNIGIPATLVTWVVSMVWERPVATETG